MILDERTSSLRIKLQLHYNARDHRESALLCVTILSHPGHLEVEGLSPVALTEPSYIHLPY